VRVILTVRIPSLPWGTSRSGAICDTNHRRSSDFYKRATRYSTGLKRTASGDPQRSDRFSAESMWPAVVAIQRLAYRVLAACGSLEEVPSDRALETANELLGCTGFAATKRTLTQIAAAVRDSTKPALCADLPAFLGEKIQDLSDCLLHARKRTIRCHRPRCQPATRAIVQTFSHLILAARFV
jgi:hypothetical protein